MLTSRYLLLTVVQLWLADYAYSRFITNRPIITQQPDLVNICGKSKVTTKNIFPGNGGVTTDAQVGDWPWMAALFFKNKTSGESFFNCGGSLISNRWVVTAAHCFSVPEEIDIDYVQLGEVKKNYEHSDAETTRIKIYNYIVHPHFDTAIKKINDIALIQLEVPVTFTDSIRPICLPPSLPRESEYFEREKVFVTGWGASHFDSAPSDHLKTISLKMIKNEKCAAEYSHFDYLGTKIISEKTICAGGGTSTVCHGDSGGPLTYYNESTDRFYLEGIVSFSENCKETFPAVFTRIAYFKDWMEINASEKFPAPN